MIKKSKFFDIVENNYQFNLWNRLKRYLNNYGSQQWVKEGQLWWCSMGKNIGVEINGKNAKFDRPVVVFKKLGKWSFLAIPTISRRKTGNWYVHFKFKGRDEYANLAQIRVISVLRLRVRMGETSDKVMKRLRKGLYDLYIKE